MSPVGKRQSLIIIVGVVIDVLHENERIYYRYVYWTNNESRHTAATPTVGGNK